MRGLKRRAGDDKDGESKRARIAGGTVAELKDGE